ALMTVFALAKFYVWLWRLKPPQSRPPITRHNLSLGLLDLVASAALLWAFFSLLARGKYQLAVGWGGGLVLYGFLLRWCFIHWEVRRLMSSSKRWSLRAARHHVRSQARLIPFH